MSYGAGQSGVVLVEQNGPVPPSDDEIETARRVVAGKEPGYPPPCLDCAPNLVLVDFVCEDCGGWHWGYVAAHDDTCPALRGALELGGEV